MSFIDTVVPSKLANRLKGQKPPKYLAGSLAGTSRTMDELPDEILPVIAGYLPPLDAMELNNTSKALHSKLSLTASRPRRILTKFSRGDCNDDLHYGFQVPVPKEIPCHSVVLLLIWKDQGWGNRKGRMVLEAEESGIHRASVRRCGEGRTVYTSGVAPHSAQRLHITFQPKKGETYHLWYAVGGGGGHAFHLSQVRTQALVLDDPGRCFGTACSVLTNTYALGAWDQQWRPEEEFLATLEENLPSPSISFADAGDVPVADMEPKVRAFLWSLWTSLTEEYVAYSKALEEAPRQQSFGFYNEGNTLQDDDFLEDRMDFGEYAVLED